MTVTNLPIPYHVWFNNVQDLVVQLIDRSMEDEDRILKYN